jgi:glycosyltransferase involved in cell wall biosynthesis
MPAMAIPVLFLTDLLDVGGAETQLVALIHALDPGRIRPVLAVLRGEGELSADVHVPIVHVRMGGPLDPSGIAHVRALVGEESIRAIYTTHVRSSLIARWLRLRVRPPRPQRRLVVVTSEHSYKTAPATPAPELLRRLSARLSDRIIAVSEVQAAWLRRTLRLPADRVVVIPNAIDPEYFMQDPSPGSVRREFNIGSEEPVFVCIARLVPVKDQATLLTAMEGTEGHLILVGDGPSRPELERMAATPALAGRVHFAGTRADVRPFLVAASAVCLSSSDESQPVALLEAMASGRPVIATRVGGIPEFVEDGQTGLLVPPRDPAALATALRRTARDADWRARAGALARERVARDYAIRSRAQRIETMITDLVEQVNG